MQLGPLFTNTHSLLSYAAVMSLLDDIYGDDNRSVLDVALDQATPNRISVAWVRPRGCRGFGWLGFPHSKVTSIILHPTSRLL